MTPTDENLESVCSFFGRFCTLAQLAEGWPTPSGRRMGLSRALYVMMQYNLNPVLNSLLFHSVNCHNVKKDTADRF